MSTVEYRRPVATISWPFGKVSADMVQVSAAINRSTTVQFSAYSGTEAGKAANKVLSSDAAALMGKAQVLGMSHRTSPDCSVSLDDGNKGKLTLQGYMVGPAYRMSPGSITPTFSFLAEASILANLRLDIYNSATNTEDQDTRPLAVGTKVLNALITSNNMADRLREITRRMIDFWLADRPNVESEVSRQITDQRHAINMAGPLGMWNLTLKNSVKELENNWLKDLSKQNDFNDTFNGELLAMLRGNNRDFMGVVEGLMGSFQWLLVPNITGKAGHFIPMSRLIDGQAEVLQLPASALQLQGASTYDLLPVQQVLMKGVPEPMRNVPGPKPSDQLEGGYIMGGFPLAAGSASGDVIITPAPFFLDRIIRWSCSPPLEPQRGPGGKDPYYASFKEGMSRLVRDAVKFQNSTINKLVIDYCKAVYADRALGGTMASVQIPCDLKMWPGTRYQVVDVKGKHLFTGFLAAVDHSFHKKSGQGQATTTLSFSHIHFPGFTLPGF